MTDFMTNNGLDLRTVREQLNELTFEHGTRRLCIGLISDLFIDQTPDDINSELERIREQLADQDLTLEHSSDVPDQLVVVQQLKHRPADTGAIGRGVQWAARITTVALEMVIPAVIGTWLDNHFGTNLLTLVGLLIGVPLGLWHLIKMTRP
ncbi:MAG: AtpZ/AtpI family protein [Pirellulaceae bacterium]|jgi:hypothetical protein|nr:AtpZ/AtpI family protein [Pirellulaceae bacterium]MDP6555106.1 AtpZ/AtpI family protein [Pirellulaceae bacterium]MDP6718392.1 AtpZ/AtpI family protein [Pirellulaceae bacterium]